MGGIYPLSTKKTTPKEPSFVARLGKWGTKQEIQQLGQAYKKRDALQKETARMGHKIQTQGEKSQQLHIIQAWSSGEEYHKEHKRTIRYSRRPIINLEKPTNNANRYEKHSTPTRSRFANIQTGIVGNSST